MMETENKRVSDSEIKARRNQMAEAVGTSGFIMFTVVMIAMAASGYVGYVHDLVPRGMLMLTSAIPFANILISFVFVLYLGSKTMDAYAQHGGYVERYRRWFGSIERGIILGQIILGVTHLAMILAPTKYIYIASIAFSLAFSYGILIKVVVLAKS